MDSDVSTPPTRRFYFSLGVLLFIVSCIAGFLGGGRIGYERGYKEGQYDRQETAFSAVRVYPIDDLIAKGDRKSNVDSLIRSITNSVDQNNWDSVGGWGSITETNSTLVILQSPKSHWEIERLLAELRAKRNRE